MIDAHLHVVDAATAGPDRTGHPDGAWWESLDASPAAVADRLSSAGVRGGLLVQAVGAHGFDNTFAIESAAALGENWRAVAAIGADDPDPIDTIDRAAGAGATGARLFSVPLPEVSWLDAERGFDVARRCLDLGLTPTICCLPEEIAAAARLVGKVPDLEFAIDHAGFVSIGGDEGDLATLVAHDNVVLKLSTGVFDHSALAPAATVNRLLQLVGTQRIAWGSDHPQIRDRDYAALADLAHAAVHGLPDATRAAILEGTTARLWF
ncbi:MAG: amidohydrolase family protein [Acidimicrobiales bacterium]|jgi:predicted TIM-barrel fold metal-dependent hydrolase|nr:amidohydrolase family protein [Acidimicrobiales bacterium]